MFKVPDAMKDCWGRKKKPKASNSDIARIETELGIKLPKPYTEFVTQFGFVTFPDSPGIKNLFDYTIFYSDQKEIREGDISHLFQPKMIIQSYKIATTPQIEDDDEFPKFPSNFLPVGNDAGQGCILLNMDESVGSVWYWPDNEWAWGLENNTWVGFVADDLYNFINRLRIDPFNEI